jgi:hypothetical protein
MNHVYTEEQHEAYTASMFEHINANCEAAHKRRVSREAKRELAKLLRQEERGLLRIWASVIVAAITGILHTVTGDFPFWFTMSVLAVCFGIVLKEILAAHKRAPAIAEAHILTFKKRERTKVQKSGGAR